jgi:glutamate/tyrosine decarboxylase-like PLP-dependent enzyme
MSRSCRSSSKDWISAAEEEILSIQLDTRQSDWAQCIKTLRDKLKRDQTQDPDFDATKWFIGPKGEHAALLHALVQSAINAHVKARQEYKPFDPRFNMTAIDPQYAAGDGTEDPLPQGMSAQLTKELDVLLYQLQSSVPLASYRNQSHMYWDISLPSIVGYFAAMLYNQNNVAAEASPVTTALEIEVGNDLCRMLGYRFRDTESQRSDEFDPWGHITCDGSVANGESMWAARNLKFLPVALVAAMRVDPTMQAASSVTVMTCRGRRERLIDLPTWTLLNLPVDEVLALTERIARTTSVDAVQVRRAVDQYSLQAVGFAHFQNQYLDNTAHAYGVVMVPATAHYSWPKTAALLGMGTRAVRSIRVDLDGRMDMLHLREQLEICVQNQWPVLQVVAVIGTTEEGAVDPLDEILRIRDEHRQRGLEFTVHVDGAWGGYFAAMVRDAKPPPSNTDRAKTIDYHPELQLSAHVKRQLQALPGADSITLDPHKSGFAPYPAGGLCYRNGSMRQLIACMAPVVYHDGRDTTVGTYGIEGSKPGAAAASVYLSHAVIPLNRTGHGRLLGRCVFNSKRFYAALRVMPTEHDLFTLTTLQRLPSEKSGGTAQDVREELAMLQEIVDCEANDALFEFLANPKNANALQLFQAIGSDLAIVAYAFNFKTAQGINRDVALMNEMNEWLFREMSLSPKAVETGGVPDVDLIVTASEFSPQHYGDEFVDAFCKRAGLWHSPGHSVRFLISTTQNPWLTATRQGNFIGALMNILRDKANAAARHVMRRHGITPPPVAVTGK